jgi:hypothetical protein
MRPIREESKKSFNLNKRSFKKINLNIKNNMKMKLICNTKKPGNLKN